MEKILLITGASRGIGAETAKLASLSGFSLCINYLRSDIAAMELLESIQVKDQKIVAVKADISKESDVLKMFETIDDELGPITALVNNAGMLEQQCDLEHISFERWQRVFATNVSGSFLCAREAVKRMSIKNGGKGGSIVNVSSRASVLGSPHEFIDYAASKGAIDSMTIGLAKEVGDQGIRVNAVRPGLIHTDMQASSGDAARVEKLMAGVPMGRGGDAVEVARTIMWLLSDQASYTSGSFMDVSGGR